MSSSDMAIPAISNFEENINVVYVDLFGFSNYLQKGDATTPSEKNTLYKFPDVFLDQIANYVSSMPYTVFAPKPLFMELHTVIAVNKICIYHD